MMMEQAGTSESILKSDVVSLADATVGQFVEATVVAANERVITLTIGTHVRLCDDDQ